MNGLRQYILCITTAALILGMITGLVGNGSGKEILRLTAGLVMALVVIRPLVGAELFSLAEFPSAILWDAENAVSDGKSIAQAALADVIKAETEAYILDKAAALKADVHVQVTVVGESTPIPTAVTIEGVVSPYARQRLSTILETELGIPKENQIWTG